MFDASNVTADVVSHGRRVADDGWEHNAYTVTLRCEGRELVTPYMAGTGIDGPPSVDDVLESLASDAATVANAEGFEEWAADLGYNPDSRRDYALWETVVRQTDALRVFLGDAFDAVVFPD